VQQKIFIVVNNDSVTAGTSFASTPYNGSSPIEIGRSGAAFGYMNGRIDAPFYMKRIPTAGELTALWNSGKGVKYAGIPSTMKAESTLVYLGTDEYSDGTSNVNRTDSGSNALVFSSNGNVPSAQGVNYNEGVISKITDLITPSNNLIQTTLANRLLYVTNAQNGRPAFYGDGLTKGIFNASDLIGAGDVTIFCVVKPNGFGGGGIGRIIDNGKTVVKMFNTNSTFGITSDAATSVYAATSAVTLGTTYVLIITRTAAGVVNFYINGTQSGTVNQSSGTPAVASTATWIGNISTVNRGFDGNINEAGVYNSILSATDIGRLNTYLRTKWGI
jgi:hypothetical protein